MEYIRRQPIPEILTSNQSKWTQAWLDFYGQQTGQQPAADRKQKKPSDNHWLDAGIRGPLIADFHNNCGYCGCCPPIANNGQPFPKSCLLIKSYCGQVDHYWPKSRWPHLVYDWNNLIWCCSDCNKLKGSFNPPNAPIFNPTEQRDCQQLECNAGKYCLTQAVAQDAVAQQRFQHTDQKTCLNDENLVKQRQQKISQLTNEFNRIDQALQRMPSLPDQMQQMMHKGWIQPAATAIFQLLEERAFYVLTEKTYHHLRQEYPQVVDYLDQFQQVASSDAISQFAQNVSTAVE